MSMKHSIASRARWARVSKEKRSKLMSKLATIKQAKLSKEERVKHATKMSRSRDFYKK